MRSVIKRLGLGEQGTFAACSYFFFSAYCSGRFLQCSKNCSATSNGKLREKRSSGNTVIRVHFQSENEAITSKAGDRTSQGDHIGSLYSYVVRIDSGFAPNPFGQYCTLACCKPQIRRHASVEDWVVGSGSKRTVGNERIVYAMKITETLSFDEYSYDPRFRYKIPSQGITQERGDNIDFKEQNGDWKQRASYHTEKQMNADIRGEYVLISDHFFYFGAIAVLVPERFRGLMSAGRWYSHIIGSEVADFVAWLRAT